ncbi:hypothetical protein D3C78_785860 [compost metagenome]
MDLWGEQFSQGAARGFLPTGAAREVDVGIHGKTHPRQHQFLGAKLIGVQAHGLAKAQPGLDAAVFTGRAVVVKQALNPLATDLAVRAVGQNRGVFQGDVHLVVKPVGDPALDLLAACPAFVHRHVIGVVDVVVGALGPQGGFEFGGGQRCMGHCGSPGINRRGVVFLPGLAAPDHAAVWRCAVRARCSSRHTPLQHCAEPVRRAGPSPHRGSGWCC